MKTTKMLLFVFVILMMAASCKSVKVLPSSNTTTTEKEETTKRIETIDTLKVVREADTARIAVKATSLTAKPVSMRSKHATVFLSKENGEIKAECKCDGLEELVELQRETIETYKEKLTKVENTTVIQESWWMGWLKPFTPFIVIGVILFLYKQGFFNFKKNKQ